MSSKLRPRILRGKILIMIYLSFKSVILDNECELKQVGGWFCMNSELGNQGGRRFRAGGWTHHSR